MDGSGPAAAEGSTLSYGEDEDGPVSSAATMTVACVPGPEELLGTGVTGPVFSGT